MKLSDDHTESVLETIFESLNRNYESYEDLPTPLAPMETRGVRRSNDLSRLLPSEAINLTRTKLRTLFYARLHEHSLSTYLVDGVMPQSIETEDDIEEEKQKEVEQPKSKRGPIIACLDTSGSMHGAPETIAKALVLEALRTANQQQRPCYLITFSGPDQIETLDLSLDDGDHRELLAFLNRSFHGGTDLVAPINEAAALLEQDDWTKSDILLVSDGVFKVPPTLTQRLQPLRDDMGLQLHGVLIANYDRGAMSTLCDEVHEFDNWEALR